MSRNLLAAIVLLAVAASCKSKKPVTHTPVPEKTPSASALLVRKINAAANDFTYYSARGKAEYKDPGMDQNLGLHIVMEKDSYIWISVTALLGIEAARMLITNDSVTILDRLHSKCIVAGFDYIRKTANADLKLQQLQQIIIGNAPFPPDENNTLIDTSAGGVIAASVPAPQQQQTALYNSVLRLVRTVLADTGTKREFSVDYSDPYNEGPYAYPSGININIRAEKVVECKIVFGKFAFEKKKDVQFSIPKNYELVRR